ncbi:MAG: glycosyltransferase family 39 protein [Candidatus Eisenbacteria bacterium]|nr:glycosyltransferase family 39 protein [Candidatus Eisenbacteria bacterium]
MNRVLAPAVARDAVGRETDRKANLILLGLASLYFLVEWLPGIRGAYGYFIDEFYYLACASHLAPGYVDHPPLSVFLLWAVRAVIGDSLPALRLVPALAGAATIGLIGLIARRLGAGWQGQALAAGAAMAGTIYHITFSFYSMNALSVLLWTACFWVLVEIELRNEPRLWVLFGVLAGLGLENKHTFVLLPLGLAAGLLLTRARRHLASRWLWLGCAITAALLLPNLAWQASHGWPSLEFYRNADLYKNIPTPPLVVLAYQFLVMNPGAIPVWIAGLGFFLVSKRGRQLRHLGWIYVALLGLMLIGQKSRPDRIAEAYVVLFAGGGAMLSALWERAGYRWLRWAVPATLVLGGVALAPLGLPLLPPPQAARYAGRLGIVPQIEKGESKRTELPQWLADRLGWERLADDVEAVAREIRPEERARAIILAPSYGQGGAIELLGRGRGLPPVYAVQNSYSHWGPPPDSADVAIVLGPFSAETVHRLYGEAVVARVHDCEGCMRWRDEVPIWLARSPKVALRDAWPKLKYYE